jgi:hypothetical protein
MISRRLWVVSHGPPMSRGPPGRSAAVATTFHAEKKKSSGSTVYRGFDVDDVDHKVRWMSAAEEHQVKSKKKSTQVKEAGIAWTSTGPVDTINWFHGLLREQCSDGSWKLNSRFVKCFSEMPISLVPLQWKSEWTPATWLLLISGLLSNHVHHFATSVIIWALETFGRQIYPPIWKLQVVKAKMW